MIFPLEQLTIQRFIVYNIHIVAEVTEQVTNVISNLIHCKGQQGILYEAEYV